jgi:transcriptional adapter 2-alpha
MDLQFDIDPSTFQERKRRRISTMDTTATPLPKVAPTSAPAVHEVAGFLPGRLEFEHELDNEAEDLIKDLEFGVCLEWGGDAIVEDENDADVKARAKWIEERKMGIKGYGTGGMGMAGKGGKVPGKRGYPGGLVSGKTGMPGGKGVPSGKQMFTPNGTLHGHVNGVANGLNGAGPSRQGSVIKEEDTKNSVEEDGDKDDGAEDEVTQPPPIETKESLDFKLALIEMYRHRCQKRAENKEIMFDRGLLDYKKASPTKATYRLVFPG